MTNRHCLVALFLVSLSWSSSVWARSDLGSQGDFGLKTSFFLGHARVVNNSGDYPFSAVGQIEFDRHSCSGALVGRYFALVVLSKPLGDRYGYLKISAFPPQAVVSSDYKGRLVSVGFPGDSNENRIVDPACSLTEIVNGYYLTDCSTEPGDSGGPILIPGDDGRYSIIAIKVAVRNPETSGGKYDSQRANIATILSNDAPAIENFIQEHDNSRALSDLISNENSNN